MYALISEEWQFKSAAFYAGLKSIFKNIFGVKDHIKILNHFHIPETTIVL